MKLAEECDFELSAAVIIGVVALQDLVYALE